MKNKKLSIIAVIICMITIFMFSSQPASQSLNLSNNVVKNTVNFVTNKSLSDDKINNIVENTVVLVRKSAHFIIYLILGLLVFNMYKNHQINSIILISLLTCLFYAISDEIHQLFIIGREGKITDVIIDTLGSLTGILMCFKFRK